MIPAKRFYMIRHGETEANAAKIMAGSLDSPLTEAGRQQAENVHKVLETLDATPDVIVHSHLSRARDTAHIINTNLNVPVHEDRGLAEIHVGELEGVPYEQCPSLMNDWSDPPGGETFPQFFERIRQAKNRALERYEGTVLIVSHGGVFRAFGGIYGIKAPGVPNCQLHEFEPDQANAAFPWKVWRYTPDEEIVREEASLYVSSADTIAS